MNMLNGDRPSVTKKREKASRCLISDCGEEKKLGGRKDRMIDIHACCVPTLRARVTKPCTYSTGFRNPGSPESSCRKRFKFNKCVLKFKSSAFSFKIGTNFPDNRICVYRARVHLALRLRDVICNKYTFDSVVTKKPLDYLCDAVSARKLRRLPLKSSFAHEFALRRSAL